MIQSCPSVILWTVARQAPLSMGFSRQEYWSGLPCPPPGELPDSGIEPTSPAAPALQAVSLPLSHQGSPLKSIFIYKCRHPTRLTGGSGGVSALFPASCLWTLWLYWGFPSGSAVNNPPAMQELQETQDQSLSQEDSLEKEIATLSSILAWRISWT